MKKLILGILKCFPEIIYVAFFNLFHWNEKKHSRVFMINKLGGVTKRCMKKIGIEFVVTGRENLPCEQSYLICPNHQAAVDPTVMISLFDNEPLSIIGKKELRKLPLIGKLNLLIGSIFMDRGDLKKELKCMLAVKKSMEENDVRWIIFPEGTRTKDKVNYTMNEFKAGCLKYPMKIHKKIVPVALHGTYNVFSKDEKRKKIPVYVHFFPPITPEDYEGKTTQEVAEMMQEIIRPKVKEFLEYDNKIKQAK